MNVGTRLTLDGIATYGGNHAIKLYGLIHGRDGAAHKTEARDMERQSSVERVVSVANVVRTDSQNDKNSPQSIWILTALALPTTRTVDSVSALLGWASPAAVAASRPLAASSHTSSRSVDITQVSLMKFDEV